MKQPFFRDIQKIDKMALVVTLITIFIFVGSCLFDLYSYSITPTTTPTPSLTATTTNTPRPTQTPTVTLTPTIDFTEIALTASALVTSSPTATLSLPEITWFRFQEAGYQCSSATSEDAATVTWNCEKQAETYSIQVIAISRTSQSLDWIEGILRQTQTTADEVILAELVFLARLPFTATLPDQTSTPTIATINLTETPPTLLPTIQSSDSQAVDWIVSSYREISYGMSFEQVFGLVPFRLTRQENILTLQIGIFE